MYILHYWFQLLYYNYNVCFIKVKCVLFSITVYRKYILYFNETRQFICTLIITRIFFSGKVSKILNLENKILNLEIKILNLEIKIINLESKIINLESKILNLESKIINLEIKIINLVSEILILKSKILNLEITI